MQVPSIGRAVRILLSLGLLSQAARADYTIVVDPAQLHELTLSLRLPKAEGAPHRLNVRGAAWGLDSQVHSARCGETPLKQQKDGTWIAESSCREVTWNVGPVVVADGRADVSQQATLLFQQPRWLLLSEPTSLLRLMDVPPAPASRIALQPGAAAMLGATALGERTWRMPGANDAPEFFVIGDAPVRSRTIGTFEVRYVADNPGRVEALGLEPLHEKALEYLGRLLPPPSTLPAAERTLLVVWVGIDERRGKAGGAAGSRSFVANYLIGKPESARLNAARTLYVLAHEQFHQLAELVRGPRPPLPAWLNESLATYYGVKALLKVAPGAESQSIRTELAGATFWTEVDTALRSRSADASDLDALVPALVRSEVRQGARLPEAFLAELRANLGARADELLAKYVGD
ncbi:MAG TPA: hypothetical protein VGP71_05565 [Burkholderiales bacterium]|jgi:hypothetical protein|nr:hypothetical protein [Burkholderiales bacterium]